MEGPDEILAHLTLGGVVVYGIEWLKGSGKFPWITASTKTLNRIVSLIAAAVVALGVGVTGDASHGWAISVPPLAALLAGVWETIKQLVLQQVLYDGVVAKQKGQ